MGKTITVVVKRKGVSFDTDNENMEVHLVDANKGLPRMKPGELVGYTVTGAIICDHGNLIMELEKKDAGA